MMEVPSLEECLGIEGLRKLRELDEGLNQKPYDCNTIMNQKETDHVSSLQTGNNKDGEQVDTGTEESTDKEAASHGAAGQLTSVNERTGQEP
jgi:hypothetical protein